MDKWWALIKTNKEISASVKCREFIDWVSKHKLLKQTLLHYLGGLRNLIATLQKTH